MRRTVVTSLLLSALSVTAHAEPPSWRHSEIWDDGNAEFCAYEATWPRYGRANEGRALLITVKEPWAPDLDVKADRPRADGFEVIKFNHVRDVPTGIYSYHQMASLFWRRDSGELQKIVATSSEGCGISTAQMTGGRLNTRSYFDGQGERELDYPAGAIPEDGLPAALREYVEGELPQELTVFPTLMAARFPPLEPSTYRLSRRSGVPVEVAAGSFTATAIELQGGGTYYFSAEAPHSLLLMERADGTRYELARCDRIPYWSMAGPEGERWLPEQVR